MFISGILRSLFTDRYVVNELGFFGGRCDMCHDLTHHTLSRVGNRIWLLRVIPLWATIELEEGRCHKCGVHRIVKPDLGVEPRSEIEDDAEGMTMLTNHRELNIDYILYDFGPADIQRGTLTPEQRQTAIELFLIGMRYEFERCCTLRIPSRRMHIAGIAVSAVLVLAFVVVPAIIVAPSPNPLGVGTNNSPAARVIGAAIVGCILISFLIFVGSLLSSLLPWCSARGRATRSGAMALLAKSLAPLQPREEELERLLAQDRSHDLAIAKVVRARKLAIAAERERARSA